MQPIKFQPLLKQTLWGGDKIVTFKHLDSQLENVGESWEISGVKDNETIVKEGPLKGKSLNEVVAKLKDRLVGKENYQRFGDEFPLLIKFIDARQDLSIQVHPNDEIAHKQGKPRGKTEMWYLMESEPGAKLYCGLKKQITPDQYKEMVDAGRIHAIGPGCFLAEIQQTSDVTYRIYDYKRKDKNGNYRELHTKLAAESINYQVENDYRTHYVGRLNKGVSLVQCPYFCTAVYDLNEPMTLDYSELDSFVILIGLKGEGKITDNEGNEVSIMAGDTLLIPATTETLSVSGTIKFLETYI